MKILIAVPLLAVITVIAWWLPRVPDSVPVALFFTAGPAALIWVLLGRRRRV